MTPGHVGRSGQQPSKATNVKDLVASTREKIAWSQGVATDTVDIGAAIATLKTQLNRLDAFMNLHRAGSMNYDEGLKARGPLQVRIKVLEKLQLQRRAASDLAQAQRPSAGTTPPVRGHAPASTGGLQGLQTPDAPKANAAVGSETSYRPGLSWDNIVGLGEEVREFRSAVEMPLLWPQLFGDKELAMYHGVLLFGQPGTGKTLLAETAASNANATFISVTAADIMAKWVGDSEKNVRQLFERARAAAPTLIFFDECDVLCGRRTGDEHDTTARVKTEFLSAMDGFKSNDRVLVIGATNRPQALDSAFLRRFERQIHIPLPDAGARVQFFQKFLAAENTHMVPQIWAQHDFAGYAECTEGCSGDDIAFIAQDAAELARDRWSEATHWYTDGNGFDWPCSAQTANAFAESNPAKLNIKFCVDAPSVIAAIDAFHRERIQGSLNF